MNARRSFWLVPLALLAASAFAQQTPPASVVQKVTLHIDPQPVGDALSEFGRQTGLTVMIQSAVGRGVTSPRLEGQYTPASALDQLLAHTGLHYEYLDAKTVAVLGPRAETKTTARRISASESEVVPSAGPATDGSVGAVRLASMDEPKGDADENKSDSDVRDYTPEILIRGSRSANVDVKRSEDDVQPYYILDSKQIEQSGAVNLEDFLKQQLTMNTQFQSYGQNFNDPRGTISTINLRGLGSNETLILVDGRRSAGVSYAGTSYQPDINGIPVTAIERIEVLPSSGSAIYGGAAVGGVVNIILKKNYQGGNVSYTFENTVNGHAPIHTVDASYGSSFWGGKTQIMLAGHYSDSDPLLAEDRIDLIRQGYSSILRNDPGFLTFNSTSFPIVGATPNIGTADGVSNLTLKGTGTALNSPIATIVPGASAATPSSIIPGQWNYALAPTAQSNGLLVPIGAAPRVKSLIASIRQELTPNIQLFTDFSTVSNISNSVYDPFDTNAGVFVPSSSPANPFNEDVNVSFPNTVTTPYLSDSVTQSATVGIVARLPADWKSELDYTWSRNSFEVSYADSDRTAFNSALSDGTINPFVDTLVHPLNLTPYIASNNFGGRSTLNDLGLRSSGPIGSFPWGRPTLTIGLEHRKEASSDSNFYEVFPLTSADNQQEIFFGQSQSTDSIYAEAQIPLVTAKNALPLIRSIDLQLAGRSEKYTVNAGTPYAYILPVDYQAFNPPQGLHRTIKYTSTNPTVGLKYKPVEDLTFRVSYATAFLPPTFSQLLPNPSLSRTTLTIVDPQNGETYPVNYIQGGNPNLEPQTAKDWDIGLIFEPQAEILKGLRMDLEYYRIKQPNYITTPSPQLVVDNPAYASRVTRDPATGRISVVDISYVNAEEYKSSGWDLTLDYRKPTTIGTFDLHAVGTVIAHDERQYTIGGPFLDYVGYPSEGGEGKIKANATLTWDYRQWTVGWAATYFGNYKQFASPGSPYDIQYYQGTYTTYTDAQGGYAVPSQTYHDVFGSYSFGKTSVGLLSDLKFQFGIKNVFNKLPPLDAYYFPYYYSPYGNPRLRDYRLGISKSF